MRLRVVIGSRDEAFGANLAFHEHLVALGIPHDWIERALIHDSVHRPDPPSLTPLPPERDTRPR